jgi:hypothetical protein
MPDARSFQQSAVRAGLRSASLVLGAEPSSLQGSLVDGSVIAQ